MSARSFDAAKYARLLTEFRPAIIETPEEHDRLLTAAESLMEKGDALDPEEEKLLALLVLVIESFESSVEEDDEEQEEPPELPKPHETLKRLMEVRGLEPTDIADIFGNPHMAREALAGRRPISRGQAKQLSNYFRVPPKLFHS